MKKLLLSLIVFFLLSFSIQAAPLTVSTSNPRYFEDDAGNVVYLTGSHTWGALMDVGTSLGSYTTFDFTTFLGMLTTNGHNFTKLWRWPLTMWKNSSLQNRYSGPYHPWQRTGPGTAYDGGLKFDLTKFNQDYFDRLRARVVEAQAAGIYVGVMLYEGNCISWTNRYPSTTLDATSYPNAKYGHPMFSLNNINGINGDPDNNNFVTEVHLTTNSSLLAIQLAYAKKVVDTLYDLDNVIYEIGNEMGSYADTFAEYIVDQIQAYELATYSINHPIGRTAFYHQNPSYEGTNAPLWASSADWVSPGNRTTTDNWQTPQLNSAALCTRCPIPILLDSDHLWGIGGTVTWVWQSFAMGHNVIWMDAYNSTTPPGGPWSYALPSNYAAVRSAMGNVKTYADKMDLKNITPQPTLCSTGYCMAETGAEYLFFQSGTGSFTATMVSGIYDYEWFNPTTGTLASSGEISISAGSNTFTPPFTGIAVLYLKYDRPLNDTPPGTGIWADSCNNTQANPDVNNAIALASRGDTVNLPAGNCTWDIPVDVSMAISIVGQGSNLAGCTASPATDTCITSNLEYGAKPFTSLTSSGTTATLVFPQIEEWYSGQIIRVSGADQAAYNGVFTISAVNAVDNRTNTIRYTMASSPGTPATGSINISYPKSIQLVTFRLNSEDVNHLARVSGMYFNMNSWSGGYLFRAGQLPTFLTKTRVDNNYFVLPSRDRTTPWSGPGIHHGWVGGVVDNNTFDILSVYEVVMNTQWSASWRNTCPIGTTGDSACTVLSNSVPYNVGEGNTVFYEDNTFRATSYSQMIVAGQGSSQVVRYNKFDYSGSSAGYFYILDTHGHQRDYTTGSFGGEVYGNEIIVNPSLASTQSNSMGSYRGNKHRIFYNHSNSTGYTGLSVGNLYPPRFLTNTNPAGYPPMWACPSGALYSGDYSCSYDGRAQWPEDTYIWNNRSDRSSNNLGIISIGRGDKCRAPWGDYCQVGDTGIITGITRSSSTATVTHASAHGLSVGNKVIIRGADQSEYNGTKTVASIINSTQYTYTVSGTPASPATGTIRYTNLNNCYAATAGTYSGGTVNETILGACFTFPSPLDYNIKWLRTDQDSDLDGSAPNLDVWFDAANMARVTNTTTLRAWRQNGAANYDGTVGIGCGKVSARPATCTEGTAYWVPADSMYQGGATDPCGTVPVGSYGPNPSLPIDGVLYICGSSNWTNARTYKPYPYPHPLRTPVPTLPDTTVPEYVSGSSSPAPTPELACDGESDDVPISFRIIETESLPLVCIGCTSGVDGCTDSSTYDQINAMASKISFTSTLSGGSYLQTATKTSLCNSSYRIVSLCKDSAETPNKMTSPVIIPYSMSTETPETVAPVMQSAELMVDGRTVKLTFDEIVNVNVSYNIGKDGISWDGDWGDYGGIYARGSGTKYLYFQFAECISSTPTNLTMQWTKVEGAITDINGNDWESQASPVAVTNNSTQTCGATVTLWNHSDTPGYTNYTQGNGIPTILGMSFKLGTVPGNVTKVCFYKDAVMDGETHVGYIWGPNREMLAFKTFASETTSGWQCQTLDTPVGVPLNQYYTIGVSFPDKWLKVNDYFNTVFIRDDVTIEQGYGRWIDNQQVVYPSNGTSSNFWIDFEISYQTATGPWAVTGAKVGSGCSITPTTQVVEDEATASATVTINPGWLAAWSDTCGGGTLDGNTYTATSVEADCTITVTCTQKPVPCWFIP